MQAIITIILIIGLFPLVYFTVEANINDGNKQILYTIIGAYAGWVGACVNYWVGTTFSSGNKDQMLYNSKPIGQMGKESEEKH